jgi:hypothetical protein
MNAKLKKSVLWAVVLSEGSHVFCCVFPTLFSLLGLLASVGIFVAMPAFMVEMHDFLHVWEIPLIALSGVLLAFGWAVVLYSDKIDCHSTGCAHGACAPRKTKAHLVLKIATAVFVVNLLIYAFVHRMDVFHVDATAGQAVPVEHHHDH